MEHPKADLRNAGAAVWRRSSEAVKEKALGQEVMLSIQPGQQVIKVIHDELVTLLGSENAGLEVSGNPSSIMMVGLHGSGKTTSSAKLARLLLKQARLPLLVGADVYRPAATWGEGARSKRDMSKRDTGEVPG